MKKTFALHVVPFISAWLLLVSSQQASAQQALVPVTYLESTEQIANPERGFYNQVDCDSPINAGPLQDSRLNQGDTLVLCVFRLDEFVYGPISQARLEFFQGQMAAIREAGAKVILRFAYNFSDNGMDATPALLGIHLDQLAPYLEANKDVIAVMQAGFIGSWGEWANSRNYGGRRRITAQNWNDRRNVVDKLLQVVPRERMIQLRTPEFKLGIVGPEVLTAIDVLSGSAKARIGFHNDCFLADESDWGTYTNIALEYPYLAAETHFVPMGGETCNFNPPRSNCTTALAELAGFHWSYLNGGFNESVIANFAIQGCFTQIKQKLGYRFVLLNGSYSSSARPGGGFSVNFTVRNDGWAAPYNSRNVELVLRNTATNATYRFKLNTDPRQWLPGQVTTVSENVTLPVDMPQGNYAAFLALPDPLPSLFGRPEYAIQLANANIWEASTGLNNLNHMASIAP